MDLHNPKFSKKGFIQVYTGRGKGKTTASMGLVTRALGRGWKVFVMQFCKVKNHTGEYQYLGLENPCNLAYSSCGLPHYPNKLNVTEKDKQACRDGWGLVLKRHKQFDLIVLDELNIAIDFEFLTTEEVLEFLNNKPQNLEIVITGRNIRPEILEAAHLVTEMVPLKHYIDIGVQAREGIEY